MTFQWRASDARWCSMLYENDCDCPSCDRAARERLRQHLKEGARLRRLRHERSASERFYQALGDVCRALRIVTPSGLQSYRKAFGLWCYLRAIQARSDRLLQYYAERCKGRLL
jgi:tRNA(Ile)-lysidine synthase TilS/MesJ